MIRSPVGVPPSGGPDETRLEAVLQRRGFTLLEMILALAIGLVLMSALYVMMSSQFSQAQSGRDAIEEATLARAILTRIASDIVGSLSAHDPRQLPDADETDGTAPAQFNLGVQGLPDTLILSSGRVPREALLGNAEGVVCDLRRITYWVVPELGLARHEVLRVTGEDIELPSTDLPNPERYVFASEVVEIVFQYWDPEVEWLSEWDGSQPADAPLGPPAAIEITIRMAQRANADGERPAPREYRHVVTLPTGNNFSPPTTAPTEP